MNRRDLLKTLFGGIAAAVAPKSNALPGPISAGSRLPMFPLDIPKVSNDLKVVIHSSDIWTPPDGIEGSIIVQGFSHT